jgi:hypothetical protein
MAETCRLTQKQTIDWAVRYAPSEEHELWEMQEAVGTNDWEQFKKKLYDLYPGSTGEQKYLVASLQSLIEKQIEDPINTAEEFGIYR